MLINYVYQSTRLAQIIEPFVWSIYLNTDTKISCL